MQRQRSGARDRWQMMRDGIYRKKLLGVKYLCQLLSDFSAFLSRQDYGKASESPLFVGKGAVNSFMLILSLSSYLS
jgi:hypothetical protein